VRGGVLIGSSLCFVYALRDMPLAGVTALNYSTPMMVVVLAVIMLGERLTPMRVGFVVAGVVGMLLIVKPGTDVFRGASLLALASAAFYALYQIMTRKFSENEDPIVTLFFTAIVGCVVLSFVMPFVWVTPTLAHIPLFVFLGAAAMVGHYLLIKALELERASILSPFGYTQLLWVTLFGFLVFGQWPDRHAFIGMAIIVGSGLYVAWGHRGRRNEEPDSAIE